MKKTLIIFTILFSIFYSCQTEAQQNTSDATDPNMHKVVVEEIINADTYMYLKVTENNTEKWIATSPSEVKEGQVVYFTAGLEMRDFTSKEINRTFDKIYFVSAVSESPMLSSKGAMMGSGSSRTTAPTVESISVSPAKGGITVAQLFSKKDELANKKVIIKGQVVKFNPQIMGKNWLHLQDGTKDGNNTDITITTNDVVKVGDVVTFEGRVTLNKDFGAGYSYEVIVEEAKLKVGI